MQFSNQIVIELYTYLSKDKQDMYVATKIRNKEKVIAEFADLVDADRRESRPSFTGATYHALKLGVEYVVEAELNKFPVKIVTCSKPVSSAMQGHFPIKDGNFRKIGQWCLEYVKTNIPFVSYYYDERLDKEYAFTLYQKLYGNVVR